MPESKEVVIDVDKWHSQMSDPFEGIDPENNQELKKSTGISKAVDGIVQWFRRAEIKNRDASGAKMNEPLEQVTNRQINGGSLLARLRRRFIGVKKDRNQDETRPRSNARIFTKQPRQLGILARLKNLLLGTKDTQEEYVIVQQQNTNQLKRELEKAAIAGRIGKAKADHLEAKNQEPQT